MSAVNNKSLLHFLFNQMEKLDKKECSVEEAKAVANIAKQINNSMKYELDRASLLNKLQSTDIKIRDIESFDMKIQENDK